MLWFTWNIIENRLAYYECQERSQYFHYMERKSNIYPIHLEWDKLTFLCNIRKSKSVLLWVKTIFGLYFTWMSRHKAIWKQNHLRKELSPFRRRVQSSFRCLITMRIWKRTEMFDSSIAHKSVFMLVFSFFVLATLRRSQQKNIRKLLFLHNVFPNLCLPFDLSTHSGNGVTAKCFEQNKTGKKMKKGEEMAETRIVCAWTEVKTSK